MTLNEVLRNMPQIDEIIKYGDIPSYREFVSARRITEIARRSAELIRSQVVSGDITAADRRRLLDKIARHTSKSLRDEIRERGINVINGTGIIIHTNLGRAPLSEKAAEKALSLSSGYSNLEYGCYDGQRRGRLTYIEKLITDITGAEAAIVTNNNAAAVFLALNTLCRNKDVIVSRGELVEIGDSFRISEIIAESGASVKEVGTTNKTYSSDYEKAVGENTGVLLKVHTSNFKVVGFTESVTSAGLKLLREKHGVPVMEDMGSGVLFDLRDINLKYERTVQDAVKDGVDIITFSGDKMLGGPQAGIIAGKRQYIDKMRRNQLMRCLRADKMCIAALEATLHQYLSMADILEIPVYKMAAMDIDTVKKRAEHLKYLLFSPKLKIDVKPHYAQFGGGSQPFEHIDSYALYISSEFMTAATMDCFLRRSPVPVIGTIQNDEYILDLRTISDADFDYIAKTFAEMLE